MLVHLKPVRLFVGATDDSYAWFHLRRHLNLMSAVLQRKIHVSHPEYSNLFTALQLMPHESLPRFSAKCQGVTSVTCRP